MLFTATECKLARNWSGRSPGRSAPSLITSACHSHPKIILCWGLLVAPMERAAVRVEDRDDVADVRRPLAVVLPLPEPVDPRVRAELGDVDRATRDAHAARAVPASANDRSVTCRNLEDATWSLRGGCMASQTVCRHWSRPTATVKPVLWWGIACALTRTRTIQTHRPA